MNKNNLFLILAVSAIILIARLLPHAPNFSPLAAVIIFTGVYAKKPQYLVWPLLALLVSDFFLGFYDAWVMMTVYGALALNLVIGQVIKRHHNIVNLISASLLSALLFYLLTNFAVWAASDWYQNNLSGLLLSYTLGIPFFKNTLASNLIYTALLFGAYETVSYFLKQKNIAWQDHKNQSLFK